METPRPFSIFFGGPFSFDVVAVAVVVVVVVEKTSEKKRHGPSSCRRRRRRRAFCVTNERVACVNEAEIPFRSLTKRRRTEEREREREREVGETKRRRGPILFFYVTRRTFWSTCFFFVFDLENETEKSIGCSKKEKKKENVLSRKQSLK